jgi:hypothetical protein
MDEFTAKRLQNRNPDQETTRKMPERTNRPATLKDRGLGHKKLGYLTP